MDEFGYVGKFPPESLKKMRDSLHKTIEINPNFTESYRLLGFINLVSNDNLDESLVLLKKGLALQPGNQDYAFLIAQIYMRQEKYAEAKEIAQKIVKTADEAALRTNAQNLLDAINRFEESKAFYQKQQQQNESVNQENRPQLLVRRTSKPLSEAELKKINEENEINNLNRNIEKPKADEKQVVGHIEKVACIKGEINYSVKTETESFPLTSKDFTNLSLNAMVEEAQNVQFGCDSDIKDFLTVITYRPNSDAKAKSKGTLLALTFVPKYFRMKTEEELAKSQQVIVEVEEETTAETPTNVPNQTNFDEQRKEAMLRAISENLRKPLDGEKRELGIVEKIECSGKNVIYNVKTATQTLKLKTNSPQAVKMMSFTPDASQMRFGCGVTFPPIPAVITYRPGSNPKDKQNGEIIALEFVPKSFKLE